MLTKRQRKILDFIGVYIAEKGYPPTIREICKGAFVSSTSNVAYNLKRLEALGYIERDGGQPRAIRLKGFKVKLIPEESV